MFLHFNHNYPNNMNLVRQLDIRTKYKNELYLYILAINNWKFFNPKPARYININFPNGSTKGNNKRKIMKQNVQELEDNCNNCNIRIMEMLDGKKSKKNGLIIKEKFPKLMINTPNHRSRKQGEYQAEKYKNKTKQNKTKSTLRFYHIIIKLKKTKDEE